MSKEEINHKDLSSRQLESLKGIYVTSRLSSMSKEDLREFVKTILSDQIHGTVGNEEEREVWKEMKEYFQDDFEERIKDVLKDKNSSAEDVSPEQKELGRRLELLEQRKQEKDDSKEDMW